MNQQSVKKGEEGKTQSVTTGIKILVKHNRFLLQFEYSTVIMSLMCYDAGPGSIWAILLDSYTSCEILWALQPNSTLSMIKYMALWWHKNQGTQNIW